MLTPEEVQGKMNQLKELAEDLAENPKEYNEWETGFILNLERLIERGHSLTEKQLNKITDVHKKHLPLEGEDLGDDRYDGDDPPKGMTIDEWNLKD